MTEEIGMSARLHPLTAVPPGVFIIEELAARGLALSDLGDGLSLGHLDGTESILPIARFLARFFGTSVTLWNNIAYQWEKRARNGQETGKTIDRLHQQSA